MSSTTKWSLLIALLLLAIVTAWGQQDLIGRVRRDLATQTRGGVFDYGELLKVGGERELGQLVEEFRREGLRLWFVTLPKSFNPNGAAEALYADLSMTEQDLLIVFNGQGCYGKTLALKGEPDVFREAFQQSRRSFHLYYAKGLGHFARLLGERIQHHRRTEQTGQTVLAALLVALMLGLIVAVAYRPYRRMAEARRRSHHQLQHAKDLLVKVTLKMGVDAPREVCEELLRLDKQLGQVRKGGMRSPQDLDKLIADLEDLDSRLPEREELTEPEEYP